ncbi:unnamed protein product [Larinioides sclopetarius]|uniref:Uncharacterized protein n=1 Tax=Larinioides sclopetarius TaxID=280406 RepID=A0AAV2A2N9_9ARAC
MLVSYQEEESRARKKVAAGEVHDVTRNVHQLSASSVREPHSGYDNSAQLMLGYDWLSHTLCSYVYTEERCKEVVCAREDVYFRLASARRAHVRDFLDGEPTSRDTPPRLFGRPRALPLPRARRSAPRPRRAANTLIYFHRYALIIRRDQTP